jgi:hypothetical protein
VTPHRHTLGGRAEGRQIGRFGCAGRRLLDQALRRGGTAGANEYGLAAGQPVWSRGGVCDGGPRGRPSTARGAGRWFAREAHTHRMRPAPYPGASNSQLHLVIDFWIMGTVLQVYSTVLLRELDNSCVVRALALWHNQLNVSMPHRTLPALHPPRYHVHALAPSVLWTRSVSRSRRPRHRSCQSRPALLCPRLSLN